MKKIVITLCFALCAISSLWAQIPVLRVETNSETAQFQVTDIDSIAFSPNADYLYVNYSGDKQRAFVAADVQQLSYGTVSAARDIAIVWNADGSVSITNPMSADGVSVTANGGDVLIESIYPGEVNYNLSGQSTNGSLKLYSDYKYQLTLLGLTLTNPNGAAINSQSKKKGTIKMQKGYTNTLTDGLTYTNISADEDEKGCIFSEGQLIFKGAGTLNVVARGKHGIASDDYLSVENGILNITTTANAAKALKANDYIIVSGGTTTITQSGSKVVEANNPSYCAALKADSIIEISGGTLTINSSAQGGRGLNADLGIIISGGTITANMTGNGGMGSSDNERPGGGGRPGGGPGGWGGGNTGGSTTTDDADSFTSPCIKTDGYVTISGGTLDFTTTGIKGFGIKAYGLLTVSGGTIMVHTSGQGAEGIESKTEIRLQGGRVLSVSQSEDAINCAGKIICSGAWVYAVSNGNDAIDSNYGRSGAITISDGVVVAITSAGSPEEGLDCDNNSYISIQGGYVFSGGGSQGGGGGWGGSSTSASVGSASQAYCFTGSYAINNGTYYSVKNASGDVLFSIKALTSLTSSKNSLSLISAPALSKNGTNSIYSGSSAPTSTTNAWDGYIYLGGTSGTTSVKTFTGK